MGLFSALRSIFGRSTPTLANVAHAYGVPTQPGYPAAAPAPGFPQAAPGVAYPPAVPPQADDGDDYARNYAQEAIDDAAGFDLGNDLAGYFVAEMQIEMAWEDVAERRALFQRFGIRDEPHFHQVQATVQRYTSSPAGQARWGDLYAIEQLKMNAHMDFHRGQMQQRAQGELSGELQPVEGISLEQWAQAQAQVASGGDVNQICAGLGIDRPHWDRVSAEWNARMSRDTTATIATAYGQAFSSAGQGQYGAHAAAGAAAMAPGGDVGSEAQAPIPFERYVEIEQAQNALVTQGHDPASVLQRFGMTPLDWSNVSAWWSQYMSRNMMLNGQELYHRYNHLQAHYAAQYGTPSADADLQF